MPFLYPLYLLGTLAAGIPIIIHMIHKRRAQRVLFSTIRFLKASNERTSRRQKIQDLLLLLLRVGLLVLLAIALAQPFLGARRWGLGQQIHAVILLDNSFSMGTEHERKTRFEAAKSLAATVVDLLPEGSKATVMLTCPPRGGDKPLLTPNRDAVRRDILRAPLSQAGGDRASVSAAIRRANDFLTHEDNIAPTLEIYVLTDLQRTAWSLPAPGGEGGPSPPDEKPKPKVVPNLVVIDCGREDFRNLAVTGLEVRGGARVRDRGVAFQAKIANFTAKPASVNVTLYVDRAKQLSQQLEIPKEGVAAASFTHKFAEPGIHTGWVQIDDDSLGLDNRRDFCLQIHDHIPALILREAAAALPQLDPTFFVAKALDPYGDDASKGRSLVQTTVTSLDQATDEVLRKQKVVILADIGTFRKSQIDDLRRYVRNGGRLIVFCGPNTRAKDLSNLLTDENPRLALLPAAIHEAPQGIVDRKNAKTLLVNGYDHPILRAFQTYRRLPEGVKVYNHIPLDIPQNSPTRNLIDLNEGGHFLLENNVEKGRVLLFTTDTDPDWSNLAASRFFLPLLHQIIYYLTEREEVEGTHLVGYPVSIALHEVREPVTLQVRDPDGEVLEVKAAPTRDGFTRAAFDQTDKRGPYIYLVLDPKKHTDKTADEARAEAEGAFAINPDPKESDLARLRESDLAAHLKGQPVYFAASAADLKATVDRMREGIPLRSLVLYIVLFIAIFECFFANRVMPAIQRAEERRAAPPATAS